MLNVHCVNVGRKVTLKIVLNTLDNEVPVFSDGYTYITTDPDLGLSIDMVEGIGVNIPFNMKSGVYEHEFPTTMTASIVVDQVNNIVDEFNATFFN